MLGLGLRCWLRLLLWRLPARLGCCWLPLCMLGLGCHRLLLLLLSLPDRLRWRWLRVCMLGLGSRRLLLLLAVVIVLL